MPKKQKSLQWSWVAFVFGAALVISLLLLYPANPRPAVAFHQYLIEGNYPAELRDSAVDLNDTDQVFNLVFSALKDEARVYPTENYYYFIFRTSGKEIWGNIHFPPATEVEDYVDFAYWTFGGTPNKVDQIDSHYKRYGAAEGLTIFRLATLRFAVSYRGKTVNFEFNDLAQTLPAGMKLRKDEALTAHTFDESGYSFFLMYNTAKPHFMFVLDESRKLPESLTTNDARVWIGEKSRFAFYQDGDRKILFGVLADNVKRNNYYDGPFDQLGDNFVSDGRISSYMQAAYPYAKSRIDQYGRFTDADHSRLAVTPYSFYSNPADLSAIIKRCSDKDFLGCITYDFKETGGF